MNNKSNKIKKSKVKLVEINDNNSKQISARQTNNTQLNLFSWQTEELARGWQTLSDLDFNKAEKIFFEVLKQDKDDEEAATALKITSSWREIFEKYNKLQDINKIQFLFSELENFKFPKAWGTMLFKDALIQEIISIAQKADVFFIKNDITISDMFLMINKPEYAENEILKYLNTNKASASVIFKLANVQYILAKHTESRQNYMKALMLNPNEINPEITNNRTLAEIVKKYSAEMTPAWGWIYSQLPMIELNANELYYKSKRGLYAYYLLWMSEKSSVEKNFKQMVNYRKLLKEKEPELYDAYFELLKKRKRDF